MHPNKIRNYELVHIALSHNFYLNLNSNDFFLVP